jgi:WD40 repeat protein
VLLYEVLTNTRPFPDGTTEQLMQHHISSPMPSLQSTGLSLPTGLDLVIWRATAKSPRARYMSARDMAAAFREAAADHLDDVPIDTPPVPSDASPAGHTTIVVSPDLGSVENPFKGLRPFEQSDAADFFGRQGLIDQLLMKLNDDGAQPHFLALIGPSGSGKSSVVKAGLLPALRSGQLPGSENWFVVEMVPGPEPFRELEAALQRIAVNPVLDMFDQLTAGQLGLAAVVERILPQDNQTKLLLFIDQFEEVFTQVAAETERRRFLESISAAVTQTPGRLLVVITLRADFYDRPLLYEEFGALVRKCSEVILPLTTQELQLAIRNPAERVGLVVEPELVTTIISDVNQQPGALPMLQYALTEVFEHREGRRLTLESYAKVGGLAASLGRRAEEVYLSLAPDRQELARQVFLRLIILDEETEAVRRRLNWSILTSLTENTAAIEEIRDTFVKYRLLTADRDPKTRETTIEVAHEALLREWDRLNDWLNTSREDVQMQRRLQAVSAEWQMSGKNPGYLLTSTRLIQFEEWSANASLQLTQDERELLRASADERRTQQAIEVARLAREKKLERRTLRWLRVIVVVLSLAAVVASILARFALDQRQAAEDRWRTLRILSRTDQASLALNDSNPELALALAFSIDDKRDSFPSQTQQMFYQAAYAPGTRLVFDKHGDGILGVAISPDGKLAASGSGRLDPLGSVADNSVRVWEIATGKEIYLLDATKGGHTDTVTGVAFSPDGRILASNSIDTTIILWDVATGTVIRRLQGHEDWVNRVVFTPDGRRLVSDSGNFLNTIIPIPGLSTRDASVRLWDVASGQELLRFGEGEKGHTAPVMGLAVSADGTRVASGDASGVIILWDMSTGKEIRRMESPGDWVSGLSFTPDGSALLSALGKPSIGGTGATSTLMVMWDPQTGQKVREFVGHTNVVSSVAVSPDGRTALTGSADYTLRLWDLASGQELQRFTGHSDWIFDVKLTPDGQRAVSVSSDATARVWDIVPGNQIRRFDMDTLPPVHAVDISADGSRALSGHEENFVVLWNVSTGQIIRRLQFDTPASTSAVYAVALSPDGKLAAAGDLAGHVLLWDTANGEILQHLESHTSAVLALAFSPDGTEIVTASGKPQQAQSDSDNTIRLWDVATGTEIRRFEGHQASVWSVAFSPDGRRIVSCSGNLLGDEDNSIRVWDKNSGAELVRFEAHDDKVNSVVFSPDGSHILSGSDDTTARLWSIETGREVHRFEGHTGFITSVLFDPDQQVIITSSDDDTIRLWHVTTGDEIYRIEGYQDTILDTALTADGRWLLAASADNDMRLWRIDRTLDELNEWVMANRYVRDLTCTERVKYRVEPYCE